VFPITYVLPRQDDEWLGTAEVGEEGGGVKRAEDLFPDRLYAWGRNAKGELGLGHAKSVWSPRLCPLFSPQTHQKVLRSKVVVVVIVSI